MDNLVNNFVEVCVEKHWNALSVRFLRFTPYKDFIKILEYDMNSFVTINLKNCIIRFAPHPGVCPRAPEYVKECEFPTVTHARRCDTLPLSCPRRIGRKCLWKRRQQKIAASIDSMRGGAFQG